MANPSSERPEANGVRRSGLSTQERRWVRLKRELARGFKRHTCLLLDARWLTKNDVTLTECGRLSEWIGAALATNLDLNALLKDLR